jgi:hypothetical protein
MGRWIRNYGGVLVAAVLAAASLSVFVARAVASAEVEPVRRDVAVLQERSTTQKEKGDRMASQIEDIWKWLREERNRK